MPLKRGTECIFANNIFLTGFFSIILQNFSKKLLLKTIFDDFLFNREKLYGSNNAEFDSVLYILLLNSIATFMILFQGVQI